MTSQPEHSVVFLDFQSIGCWRDTYIHAIQPLEGTHHLLMDVDYKNRANGLLKCAEVALEKGLKMFAVQDGGLCLGDRKAETSYKKYGPANTCEGKTLMPRHLTQIAFNTRTLFNVTPTFFSSLLTTLSGVRVIG